MWETYFAKGLSVFPVTPMTKTPEIKWSEYRTRMPKQEEIKEWSAGNYNIGVVCGAISGNLIVIDFDNPELFELVFPNIKGKTWVVKTPRPGVHVYFRTDRPLRGRNYNFAKIQVKGEGGYVLAPPSVHPNGNKYEFLEGCSPNDCEISVVKSENFFEALEKRLSELGFKLDFREEVSETEDITPGDPIWVRKMLEGVPEGERDECAIRLASYYCNVKHMAPQAVEAILLNWNTRNRPPVPNAENWVKTKVNSALKGGYVYTRNDALIRKYEEVEEEPEKEKIISQILDGDAVKFILKHVETKVKHDFSVAKTLLLSCATSFTSSPVNVFVRGPPSIGKTYVTRNISRYFPNAILIMGMSPKTIVHEYSFYSKEDDAYIVDLWHKILIFLEEPSNAVYEILRPLMSHDSNEVIYKWVEQRKNQQKTVKAIIRGWPVFIFLGTTAKLIEDLASRGIHVTPIMSGNKWVSAVILKGEIYSKPFEFIDEEDVVFNAIREHMRRVLEYCVTRQLGVIIPYATEIVEKLSKMWFAKMPRAARDVNILFDMIAGSAVLNVFRRMILRFSGNNRWYNYIIATKEDLENAISIWSEALPASISGVNSTQYELYALIKELASDPNPQELTAKFIYTKWMERFPDKPLSAETIRKYLQVLEDRGLVVSEKSERGNKTLYYPMNSISDDISELVNIENYFDVNKLHRWFDSLNGGKEIYIVYDGAVIDARNITDKQKQFILKNILNINISADINVSSEKEAVIEENKAGKDWERWEKVGNPTANDAVSSENLYNDADGTGTKSSNAHIENFGGEFMDESKEA
jgi:hypothetical protein